MPVERVDYHSDEETEEQEPDVVPCFKCGCQMYQECLEREGNICSKCESEE